MEIGTSNSLEQSLPEGFVQSQPKLECALRRAVEKSSYCSLRTSCTVTGRSREVPPTIEYSDAQGSQQQIQGQWLVGADGKRGIVRKHFLEPTAGIQQQNGVYAYEGVWVASNLHLILPTPSTHPEFPLWKLGYTPEEVYDLFWPVGWHFCSPPGRPTATGRFGPHADRTWRHEFRVEELGKPIYSEELLWEHMMPSITLEKDDSRGLNFGGPVQYPRDCIEVLRCRPFKFVQKCVDRWYYKRTILIGDAAHVFPPFAGQGIASGMRDAHQLSWRLALLLSGGDPESRAFILESWALERRRSVDDAALMSKASGTICNSQPTLWVMAVVKAIGFLESIPSLRGYNKISYKERRGFYDVSGGFFLKNYNGGARLAQIHMHSSLSRTSIMSDSLLRQRGTIFTLLVISNSYYTQSAQLYAKAKAAIEAATLSPHVLSWNSIVMYNSEATKLCHAGSGPANNQDKGCSLDVFSSVLISDIEAPVASGYSSESFVERIGGCSKFVIARPDLFVFACAKNVEELIDSLGQLKSLAE